MPVAVNAVGRIPVEQIAGSLDRAPGAPVTIMIHGYRYSPLLPAADPHRILFAPGAWPRQLGTSCIGFGWDACGSIWRARAKAAEAGRALATLIERVGPVSIIAHSLGARVALSALPHLRPGSVPRMVLLAGAEFTDTAEAALNGSGPEVLNITSRENDGYDFLYETLTAPLSGRRTIAAMPSRPGLVTVQIDSEAHRAGLARLGFPIAGPEKRVCHWSCYSRPGLFPLYRRFLNDALPLPSLRAALVDAPDPRWARLMSGGRGGDARGIALSSGV
ncbi:alpha/beta hydrolase [Falsirhodobacter xinxiangensis]|uniref:alpha/beta hydrolase n=1 Tax=Falsirhodobacter xinxiangensis TaxID=2530049 RepID=UPI0010A9A7C2|nr:alpha/beta hydrolase [Rhodobacter xinxiangensis]